MVDGSLKSSLVVVLMIFLSLSLDDSLDSLDSARLLCAVRSVGNFYSLTYYYTYDIHTIYHHKS